MGFGVAFQVEMSIVGLDLKLTLFHDDIGLCPNGKCSTSLKTDAVFDLGIVCDKQDSQHCSIL